MEWDEKREEAPVVGGEAVDELVLEKEEVRALGSVLLRPKDVNELAKLFIIPPPDDDDVDGRWVGAGLAVVLVVVEVVEVGAAMETGGV